MKKRDLKVQVFHSFKEEADAEYKRRSEQSYSERMKEFSQLQERCWGAKWTKSKIENIVSYEKVSW